MVADELVGSWVETRRGLLAEREEEAALGRRIAELEARIAQRVPGGAPGERALLALHEELVDLAEARGDLERAEAAQLAVLELSGAATDLLGPGHARLRRLVAGQHRAQPASRPPVVRAHRPRPLPVALRTALASQREGRWSEARTQLLEHLDRAPDDGVAIVNRMLCALQLGDGAGERLTAEGLRTELPSVLAPSLDLLGLLCASAAGDREAGRRHALRLAARLRRGLDLPVLPRALLPEGPELAPGGGLDERSVVVALDDLVDRTAPGDDRLALALVRAAYRARDRERAA
jgi:hypothetical protein